MPAKKKTFPSPEGSAEVKSPPLEAELTESSRHDWNKLQRLAPLNVGPRMLYVLVDSPPLRRRLAEQLKASLQQAGHPVVWLDFTQPYYQPLQEIFDQAEQHPQAKFFFLFGLEQSLLSFEHRISALTDLNFHRDQISKRLPCPLIIWIPDDTFTDLLVNAPDFTAWRGGVFTITDAASERDAPYRQHIIEQFGKLTLYSATADAPLAVDLEQVFVKLTATQQRHRVTADFSPSIEWGGTKTKEQENLPPSLQEMGISQRLRSLEREKPEEINTTLSLTEALQSSACLAVIGAPGSGKTTLLKYLALSFARRQARERLELDEDRIPVVVYLRNFGVFLDEPAHQKDAADEPAALFLRFLAERHKQTTPYLNLPKDFFSRHMEEGRSAVLLDSLDEVVDPQKRSRVIDIIAALASRYPGNRFVVTSRPRGYESDAKRRLSPRYAECTIRDFEDDDMQAFARSWYTAVTIDRQGDTPTARTTAVVQADDLLRAIRGDERVKALAHNPLLLSVLAMVHQRGVGLPQRRAELYDECTDMLLGYWDQSKGGEAARELANLGALNRTEKRALLEPVALWFHERGEHGMEVTQGELEAQIAEQFMYIFGNKSEKARQRAELFLRVIEERAGLLVERATGVYAFAHLTFQEYLAARAIADREDYIAYTLKRLHKPRWREILLLEVGHLSDQRYFGRRTRKLTSDLLLAIRNAGSWLEDVLKRDLLFAARCLCGTGPLGVEDEVRQSIMEELIALWRDTPYRPQQWDIVEIFTYVMPTTDGTRIRAELLSHLSTEDKEFLDAVRAIGNIGQAARTPEIIAQLWKLLSEEHMEQLSAISWALAQIGGTEIIEETQKRLLTLATNPEPEMRKAAAEALARIGETAKTQAVVERLLALTQDPNREVQEEAARALEEIGELDVAAQHLLKLASNPSGNLAPLFVEPILKKMHELTETETGTTAGQLLLLADASYSSYVIPIIKHLGIKNGPAATTRVVECLLTLTNDPSNIVRSAAVRALEALGEVAATTATVERLFALTSDPSYRVRRAAILALIHLNTESQTRIIVDRLVELTEDPELEVRSVAIWAIGAIAIPQEKVVERLLLLLGDPKAEVNCAAAWTLGQLEAETSPVNLERLVNFWREQLTPLFRIRRIGPSLYCISDFAYSQLQRLAEWREGRK